MIAKVIALRPDADDELSQERCSGCLTWQMKLGLRLREDCFPTALLCEDCERKLDDEDEPVGRACDCGGHGCCNCLSVKGMVF